LSFSSLLNLEVYFYKFELYFLQGIFFKLSQIIAVNYIIEITHK